MNIFSMIGDLYGEGAKRSLLIAVDIDTDEPLAALYIDATLSESISQGKTVTDHPIEKGPNISDHAHIDPTTAALHCVVSEDPLDESGIMKDSLDKIRDMVGVETLRTQMADAGYYTNKYVINAVNFLDIALREKSMIIMKIGFGWYYDMSLNSINKIKDAGNTGVLEFDIRLKELNFVKSKFVDMDDYVEFSPDIPSLGQYGSGGNPGSAASAAPVEEEKLTPKEQAERNRSRLIRFLDWTVRNIADVVHGF
jgi:hypothetical protein